MKNKKVFWIIVLLIIILTIGLSIYILKNNKENDDITINTPNISKNLFSVNVPEGIKTEIAYIQNNNYLAIVFENKTNENISSGKLKVVIGNKEIEKRLELLPIGKKAIFKIAVPNELKDTINKSKVTITLNEIKSSNDFSFIDVDKINNTKTNVSVIENNTNIKISGINKTGEDLDALIGFVVLYNNNKIVGADNIRIENIKNNSQFEKNITIPKIMIPSSDLTPDKINYGKVNYEKIEVYYTYAY